MKKIMFNERYGLESAVLNGRKTMTRRMVKLPMLPIVANLDKMVDAEVGISTVNGKVMATLYGYNMEGRYPICDVTPHYQIGEEVAIAQSYEDLANSRFSKDLDMFDSPTSIKKAYCGKGWHNKMFVKAEHMPHRIRITNIGIEPLTQITNDDAMLEGVFKYDKPPLHHESDMYAPWPPYVKPYKYDTDNLKYFCEARWAFKHLINKVSGGYTWISNPWVWVYTFKLIK